MEKLKKLWQSSGKWFLLSLPLVVLVLFVSVQLLEQSIKPVEAVPTESKVTFDLEVNPVYDSEDGVVVIKPEEAAQPNAAVYDSQPEELWHELEPLSSESYTLPTEAKLEDCLAVLTIPRIGISAQVFEAESTEMEAMTKGIAHFAVTSAWDGNVGLCSHNVAPQGAVAYFRDLHLLEKGDEIQYKTAMGERVYAVSEVKEIHSNDWSYLKNYDDGINRITLITCVSGKADSRLMVQAVEE